jgi:hypothetical protein
LEPTTPTFETVCPLEPPLEASEDNAVEAADPVTAGGAVPTTSAEVVKV